MSRTASRPLPHPADATSVALKRVDRWLWAIPAFVAFGLILPSIGAWCVWAPDSVTTYLPIARTLSRAGELPPVRLIAPPGYSVLLAPILAIWGDTPLLALRIAQGLAFVAIVAMVFFIHRGELSKGGALAASLAAACSPVLLTFAATPLAEIAFTLMICAWLLVMHRWESGRAGPWYEAAWVGVFCAAISLTRSIGAVTIPVSLWVMVRCFSPRVPKLLVPLGAFCICSVGPLIAWEMRQSLYPGSDSYRRAWTQPRGDEAADLRGPALYAHRLGSFGIMRLAALKETLAAPDPYWRLYSPPWSRSSSCVIGGMLIAIALVRFAMFRRAADGFVVSTVGLLVFWPYDEGVRLVAPLIPILVAYPVWLIERWLRSGRTVQSMAAWALAAGISGLYLPGVLRWESRLSTLHDKENTRLRQMHELAAWQVANLSTGGSYIGVTPYRDNSKLLLAGASYLAERHVRPIDCMPQSGFDVPPDSFDAAFVHSSLASEAELRWGMHPRARTGPFAIFVPESADAWAGE
ncbi:MAG TPA: glycosyltransferase family 39 protein [Phycisphaerae bacterium]|nr:glycosyltransferase family 39 protein [Phycisphaerae bacterium]